MVRWKRRTLELSLAAACGLLAAGCTTTPSQPSDEQVRRQAAQAADRAHHDAEIAGREARKALAAAGRETRDIVAGAREGWKEGDTHRESNGKRTLNVNRADLSELESLPGVDHATARKIIAGRPWRSTREVQRRGVLSRAEYDRISSDISAD